MGYSHHAFCSSVAEASRNQRWLNKRDCRSSEYFGECFSNSRGMQGRNVMHADHLFWFRLVEHCDLVYSCLINCQDKAGSNLEAIMRVGPYSLLGGLVFCFPFTTVIAVLMFTKLSFPTRLRSCRIAVINGALSISLTVPPSSTIYASGYSFMS